VSTTVARSADHDAEGRDDQDEERSDEAPNAAHGESLRSVVPGTVLYRRWEPDTLIVLLENLLARDLLPLAHLGVPRFGRTRIVPTIQVRRRDEARDRRPAAR